MKTLYKSRRKFLQLGLVGAITSFFTSLPKRSSAQFVVDTPKGIVVQEDEGRRIIMGRSKAAMTIKISKATSNVDSISFCTEDIVPGRKIPVHKHLNNDELIFIQGGEGLFTLDEEITTVKSGAVIFVPRGVWHGLENTGKENIRMNFGYTPAGFEEYFVENGTAVGDPPKQKTPEEYAATEKKYGMVYKERR